ncbi:MAG: cupin domain-containing protein [Bauldia sp.]|nr:cupin domain-containing protein [Bauldia sp.]MCW5719282.1 cupin domain-containing protein [Bauldia sp.]
MTDLSAAEVVALLGLQPHPEGGHFRETFRDPDPTGGRAHSTAIYYLLAAGERSAWHRVRDAAEAWHFHAGAPLLLRRARILGAEERIVLGVDLSAGERPQAIVPRDWWQAAQSLGAWTLVGCTVAPGFVFESFELAPPEG